jgi:hypothetical protein
MRCFSLLAEAPEQVELSSGVAEYISGVAAPSI